MAESSDGNLSKNMGSVFAESTAKKLKVFFVHPDLGLGGAERLVIDAALSLTQRGHTVSIYTAHLDPSRCFPEVHPDKLDSPIRVNVIHTPFPRFFLGKFHALLAAFRCAWIAFVLCLFYHKLFNVAFCDIVSLPVAIFSLFKKPVLFYCHFPDKCLVTDLKTIQGGDQQISTDKKMSLSKFQAFTNWPKTWYRSVVDFVEEWSMGKAQKIAVNSKFTLDVFADAFQILRRKNITPHVLYPAVPHSAFIDIQQKADTDLFKAPTRQVFNLLSINRYERKKNITLALETMVYIRDNNLVSQDIFDRIHLVIAGGYDPRIPENIDYKRELEKFAESKDILSHCTFLVNISTSLRKSLLENASCLLYTPAREHFGIVPIEAMAAQCPVVAADSGGPLESIQDQASGFLVPPTPRDFAQACVKLVTDADLRKQMGRQGADRVKAMFSLEAMGKHLETLLIATIQSRS